MSFFLLLVTSYSSFSEVILEKNLWRCFSVKLQKCCVDDKTSPDCLSEWGRADDDCVLIFCGKLILKVANSKTEA